MSKMAAFFAGLGSGYLKADRQKTEDERQAKKDGQDTELFNARMDEINQAKKLNADLSTAAKPATFSENTPTLDTGDGAKVYGMDNGADVAASDARQFKRMAPDAAPPVQGQTFAVNGTAVPDKGTMQSTVKAYDEGANDRIAQAYRANGKPTEALNMNNAIMESKAKSLGLETAQLKFADDKFNRDVLSRLDANPDWTQGAAQLLTETQLGRLAGVTVNPVMSADGKTVSFVGTGTDGTSQPMATMPNTPEGRLAFTQQLMKATPEMKISWLAERGKAAKDDAAAALKQENWLKDYTLKEAEVKSKGELRVAQAEAAALRGSIAAGRASANGPGAGAPEPAFNPLGSFDSKKAQAVAFEQASKMTTDATGAPVSPEAQGQLAQKIYRSMEDSFAAENTARERARVFKSAATAAKTPEEVQALRSRAAQSGYTEQEMAQLDPRFAPTKAQGEAKPAPATPERPAKAPAYVPPADSPAGKAAANRDASKAVSMEKTMQTKKAVTDAAASAIQSGDASAAQAAQDMDGFSALPADTKAQIRKIVFGR